MIVKKGDVVKAVVVRIADTRRADGTDPSDERGGADQREQGALGTRIFGLVHELRERGSCASFRLRRKS